MVSRSQVTLIIDDRDKSFITNISITPEPLSWDDPDAYRGSYITQNTSSANAKITFYGTSISFWGHSGSSSLETTTVRIDSRDPVRVDPFKPEFASYQWYQSPLLSDEEHIIECLDFDSGFDFVLVTAGDTTPLSGRTILVDDSVIKEIWYDGQWLQKENQTYEKYNSAHEVAEPIDKTTHISTHPGDFFEFRFAGTAVSVYGILDVNTTGSFTLDFTLDGSQRRSIYPEEGRQTSVDVATRNNFQFFTNTTLSNGNHTLRVDVVAVEGPQRFELDYITYAPSFDFVGQKPVFERPATPTGSATGSPSSTARPSEFASQPSQDAHPSTTRHVPIGAIVGATIGGLILLLAVAILLFLRAKRRKRNPSESANAIRPFLSTSVNVMDQNPESISTMPKHRKARKQPLGGSESVQSTPTTSDAHPGRVRRGTEETSTLTNDLTPSRVVELYDRINMLTRENQRLVRDYVLPPQYNEGPATLGRSNSRTVTLPSYDNEL
ncbi:hypothetical protein VNI00_013678 [Paramarasmius palmivorus]|uniref:Uncharacterized protein n=1 Tax=Paramarasmius palmivorus TaxID=297713 RepID=A0AAW0BXP8_9AGAR